MANTKLSWTSGQHLDCQVTLESPASTTTRQEKSALDQARHPGRKRKTKSGSGETVKTRVLVREEMVLHFSQIFQVCNAEERNINLQFIGPFFLENLPKEEKKKPDMFVYQLH